MKPRFQIPLNLPFPKGEISDLVETMIKAENSYNLHIRSDKKQSEGLGPNTHVITYYR